MMIERQKKTFPMDSIKLLLSEKRSGLALDEGNGAMAFYL